MAYSPPHSPLPPPPTPILASEPQTLESFYWNLVEWPSFHTHRKTWLCNAFWSPCAWLTTLHLWAKHPTRWGKGAGCFPLWWGTAALFSNSQREPALRCFPVSLCEGLGRGAGCVLKFGEMGFFSKALLSSHYRVSSTSLL